MKINLKDLTDSRNQSFLNNITANAFVIDIVRLPHGYNYWSINVEKTANCATIFAGKKTNDINAFTHELLHILQEINGQYSHLTLPTLVGLSNSPFKYIFTSELVTHINNVILHERMINDYLIKGFPRNKFVYDYYYKPKKISKNPKEYKLTKQNIIIQNKLIQFLNIYFTYRFHPNNQVKNYYKTVIVDKYSVLHSDLIMGIDSICINWENKTINLNNQFFDQLLSCLDYWKSNNRYH